MLMDMMQTDHDGPCTLTMLRSIIWSDSVVKHEKAQPL